MIYLEPFRHAVFDDFLDADTLQALNDEWPTEWDTKEDGAFNLKWSTQNLPPTAKRVAQSIDVNMVEEVTGIKGLFPDPELFGAGLHCIPRGGFLNMHVDFNQHPKGWHRRVNLLIYLNMRWESEWGGQLQLGLLNDAKLIEPIGGRCVIFETNERSWHGHPHPLNVPESVQRRSLALYFYTPEAPKGEAHSTIYKKKKKK